jgi:hypothetical protein
MKANNLLEEGRSDRRGGVGVAQRDEVHDRLVQAQNLMKTAHRKSHRSLEFAPGNLVWLRLSQCVAVFVRDGPLSKLAPKYYRSYHVLEYIGGLAYRLQLPTRVRIHDVFHVAFLKKYTGAETAVIPPLPPIVRGRAVPQPQHVVHARPTAHSWDMLVKWHNSSPSSWKHSRTSCLNRRGVMLWTLIWASSIAEGGRHQVGPTVVNVAHWQDYRP